MTADPAPDRSDPYHYAVIARAIDAIAARAPEQIGLDELAAEVGLSPAHFQRVFSRWVGVSPKRYAQYLALDHARRLLAERHSLLDTAHEAGLSGSGRLHDLFVRWEAMSPGDYARAGRRPDDPLGLVREPLRSGARDGHRQGPLRHRLRGGNRRGGNHDGPSVTLAEGRFRGGPDGLRPWVLAAFGTDGRLDPAPLYLIGAPFQIKVWEALLRVPTGHVTTYSDIATAIGNPRAVRAVGTAVGRNPISWLIPCHRALQKAGGLGGYHWGLDVKRAMLAWESARHDSRAAG